VFDAVNYPEDLYFNDVYFVNLDVGYVAGQAGTILKTTNGGAKWEVQLGGDRESGAKEIRDLRFVDEQHGWATQQASGGESSLMKTTDGEAWQLAGVISEHYADLAFTAAATGVYLMGDKIFLTEDAGKTWRSTGTYTVKAEVDGLSRTLACEFYQVTFPSPAVGYALATVRNPEMAAVFKTTDQGQSWAVVSTIAGESGRRGEISFIDDNTGYLRGYSGKFFRSTDGGRTWAGVAGLTFTDNSEIRFADPEVGWAIGFRWVGLTNASHRTLVYTTTAGRLWASREIPLPAGVRAFSMPRRDRAYVVGEHGMVYRYRVVPITETVSKAIAGPVMPVFDTPLDDQVEKLDAQLEALQNAPASAFTEQLTAVEATVAAASTEAPTFAGKYRNLNLLLVGVGMSGDLLKQVQSLKESIQTLKPSPGRQRAPVTALAEVREKSKALVEMVRGFVQKKGG
jgi:photosystem II stability/assembly factor-like uncharacterized protein